MVYRTLDPHRIPGCDRLSHLLSARPGLFAQRDCQHLFAFSPRNYHPPPHLSDSSLFRLALPKGNVAGPSGHPDLLADVGFLLFDIGDLLYISLLLGGGP